MTQIADQFDRSENTKRPCASSLTESRLRGRQWSASFLWEQLWLGQPLHFARTASRIEGNFKSYWSGLLAHRSLSGSVLIIGAPSFFTVTTPARGKSLLLGLPSRGDAHGSVTRLEPVFPGSASQIKLMEGNRGATDQPFAIDQRAENRKIASESNGLPYCERTGYTGQPVRGLPVVGKARWQASVVNTPRN